MRPFSPSSCRSILGLCLVLAALLAAACGGSDDGSADKAKQPDKAQDPGAEAAERRRKEKPPKTRRDEEKRKEEERTRDARRDSRKAPAANDRKSTPSTAAPVDTGVPRDPRLSEKAFLPCVTRAGRQRDERRLRALARCYGISVKEFRKQTISGCKLLSKRSKNRRKAERECLRAAGLS